MGSDLTIYFQSAISIFNQFINWNFTLFGATVFVKDIFIFSFLVSMFFIVIKFIGDIT